MAFQGVETRRIRRGGMSRIGWRLPRGTGKAAAGVLAAGRLARNAGNRGSEERGDREAGEDQGADGGEAEQVGKRLARGVSGELAGLDECGHGSLRGIMFRSVATMFYMRSIKMQEHF